jgi:hypothetical protein
MGCDCRLVVVVVAQVRGTDVFLTALLADDVDQVRPAQANLLVEAQLIQFLQMLADHDATPFGFRNRRRREKGTRPYRTTPADHSDSPWTEHRGLHITFPRLTWEFASYANVEHRIAARRETSNDESCPYSPFEVGSSMFDVFSYRIFHAAPDIRTLSFGFSQHGWYPDPNSLLPEASRTCHRS